ncbi:MAG: hypothetical protein WC473_05260 [Patescibacteria group bacterium]|jgi:hypothetical protein
MKIALISKIIIPIVVVATVSGVFVYDFINSNDTPDAWIDAPLNNSTLPMSEQTIIYHVGNPKALKEVQLKVDDQLLVSHKGFKTSLDSFSDIWLPETEGEHVLAVYGKRGSNWIEYASATVNILLLKDQTIPNVPSTTQSEKTAEKLITDNQLTEAPANNVAPGNSSQPAGSTSQPGSSQETPPVVDQPLVDTSTIRLTPPVFSNVSADPSTFYYRGDGCGSKQIKLSANIFSSSVITGAKVYFRLKNKETGATTAWSSLALLHDGNWFKTLNSETDIPGFTSYPRAWLEFYFTAQNADKLSATSQQYTTLATLSICNESATTIPIKTITPITVPTLNLLR